jgi:membrane protein YdbS with pleckstrin-like domain
MRAAKLDEASKRKLELIWTDQTPDHLDPDVKRYWRWLGLIQIHLFFLLIFLSMVVPFIIIGDGSAQVLGLCIITYLFILIVMGALLFTYTNMYYDSFTFLLTEDMLLIEKGVLFKNKIVVPYSRVQNVNIKQGPLQRILGISSVYVITAGVTYFGGNYASGMGAHLPGIPFPDELAEIIMRKVRMYKYGEGLDDDVMRADVQRYVNKFRQYMQNKRGY